MKWFGFWRFIRGGVRFSLWLLTCIVARQVSAHGDLLARIEALSRAIEQQTNNAMLYLQRADLYRLHQQWNEAAADYNRVEQIDPSLSAVDLGRGKLFFESGNRAEAKRALDRYLGREPGDGEAFVIRARVRSKLGQPKAAAEDFTTGIALVPEPQPDYFLERAQALLAAGETNNALLGLEEGMKALGPVLTLQKAALDIEVASRQYAPALARLETILAKVTRKENWLARKGEILASAGRPEEARKAFQEALRAIDQLPPRIQQGQTMRDLRSRLDQALAGRSPHTSSSR